MYLCRLNGEGEKRTQPYTRNNIIYEINHNRQAALQNGVDT